MVDEPLCSIYMQQHEAGPSCCQEAVCDTGSGDGSSPGEMQMASVGSRFRFGPGRLDSNLFQLLGLWIKLCLPGWKAVDVQQVTQDIDYLLPAQISLLVWGH